MLTMFRVSLPYFHNTSKAITTIWLAFLTLLYGMVLFSDVGVSWSFYAGMYFYFGAFSLCVGGLSWSLRIFQAARKLHASTVPHTLWRAWLKGLLLRAWIYLIAFSLSMNLLEATHIALSNWSAVWALSALILVTSFLFVYVLSGFAARSLSLVLCAAFAWSVMTSGITSPKEWAQQLWHVHLLFVMGWIALSFALIFLWNSPPTLRPHNWSIQTLSHSRIFLHLKNLLFFYRRYSSLEMQRDVQQLGNRSINYSTRVLQLSVLFWFSFLVPTFIADWGTDINLKHLLYLSALSALADNHLVGRDLHWRFLLRPKGLQQGRIGSHILLSTLRYYAGFLLIIAAMLWLLHHGVSQLFPTPASWFTSKLSLAFPQLVMCISIAIAVRGFQRPRRVYFYLFNGALAISAVYSLVIFFQGKNPLNAPITTMSFPYLVVVITVTISALILANKLWTQERLLPYLKAQ